MSNVQIPNLPASVSLNGNEQLEAVQAGTSVRITTDQIATYTQAQYPAPGVSSIATTAPITGGTITSTGTIGLQAAGVDNSYLASMAGGTVKANVTGSPAQPSDVSVSGVLDVVGSTRGTVLYRGVSSWSPLLPGSANNILISNGSGADPSWQSISATLDTASGSTQGAILYRSASTWTELSPGLSGQILQTNGGGADPSWATIAGAGTVTQVNTGTGLTGGPITGSGTISIANTGVSAASYGSASAVPAIAINAQGQITSAVDTAIAIPASQITSGTLGVDRGGTGASSLTANGILYGNSTSAVGVSSAGATGEVLVGNTGSAPTWGALSSNAVTSFSGGTTGLTPSSATQGVVTLAGTLAVANGGTGLTATPANGQIDIGNGTGFSRATLTAGSGVSITNGAGSITIAASGAGTVTSVDVSGGTTGLTTSGGPVTSSGTITLAGTLGVANGGTGTATAFTAGSVVFAGASGVYAQDNTNLFFDDTNNRLGIGTASPDAALTVNTVASFGAGAIALPSIASKGDLDTGIWFPAINTIAISTAAAERFRITSTGNVGIGTSAADAALTVNTVASFGAGAAALPSIAAKGDLDTGIWFPSVNTIAISTAAAERFRIISTGGVGIGTSSPSSSAILDAQSTTKGVRMPNMTTTQKNAIASPAPGLMVFDTTLAKLCVYSGAAWETITSV